VDQSEHPELDALLGGGPHRRRRHLVAIVLLLAAVGVALALFTRLVSGSDSPYYTAVVQRGDITPHLALRGILHGDGEVTVTAAQEGAVQTVPAAVAVRVSAGEELVGFDTRARAPHVVDAAVQAQMAAAQGDALEVTLREARAKLARFEDVWRQSGGRVPAQGEMDHAKADVAHAEIDLANARNLQHDAEHRMAQARAALADNTARAPLAGYLLSCQVVPGQTVLAGEPLCTIVTHPERLTLVVPVSGADASRLIVGVQATVLVDGMAEAERNARLQALVPAPDGGSTASFTLDPPSADDDDEDRAAAARTHPGMGGTVQVPLAKRAGVLLVPDTALTFRLGRGDQDRQPHVYVVGNEGPPRLVPVSVGVSDGRYTEIKTSALHSGDQVITGWRQKAQ
jgi:HlyD family secretion protein